MSDARFYFIVSAATIALIIIGMMTLVVIDWTFDYKKSKNADIMAIADAVREDSK